MLIILLLKYLLILAEKFHILILIFKFTTMKKLIKISDFYYVIDTEALIDENDYYLSENLIYKSTFEFNGYPRAKKDKVEATTNPLIPLPKIIELSDELELLIGKEIKIEIIYNWFKLENKENKKITDIAIIKPISTNESLEFEPDLFNDNSTITFTIKEVREISTNLLKEYDAKLTENPYNKGNYVSFWNYMKNHFRSRFENSSKTNETLEEVAKRCTKDIASIVYGKTKGLLKMEHLNTAFIEGYKQAESKMYSEDEVKTLLIKHSEYILTRTYGQPIDSEKWFNNNKK